MYSEIDNNDYSAQCFLFIRERMLSQSEILLYFRMKAEGKLKVKERKVFLCKELKNIKLNEN